MIFFQYINFSFNAINALFKFFVLRSAKDEGFKAILNGQTLTL